MPKGPAAAAVLSLCAVLLGGGRAEAQKAPPLSPTPQGTFCQPGLEIRCACGPGHWETTRCRDDGSNWEWCPCPEEPKPEPRREDRPSPRSSGLMAAGITLMTLGAVAHGTSLALQQAELVDCPPDADRCILAWVGLAGTGLVLTATGVPLYVTGVAKVHRDERPRSVEMLVGGSFLAGASGIAVAAGATNLGLEDTSGWYPFIFGNIGLAGGVALAIYGGWEVPDVPEAEPASDARIPEIIVGPMGAAARWTF